jgi:hypothetical protein
MQGLALLVAAYALSPIDLNPDFIPMLGYLDNVVLSPLGLALIDKPTTPEVLASARLQAEHAATDHSAIPRRRLSRPCLSRCLLFCEGYLKLNARQRTEGNPDTAIIFLHPEIARAHVTATFSGSVCLSTNSVIAGNFLMSDHTVRFSAYAQAAKRFIYKATQVIAEAQFKILQRLQETQCAQLK